MASPRAKSTHALPAPGHGPGNPVRVNAGLAQRLVDAGLIGAKRAAALQHQGDNLKGKVLRRLHGTRLNLSVHDNLHSELTE